MTRCYRQSNSSYVLVVTLVLSCLGNLEGRTKELEEPESGGTIFRIIIYSHERSLSSICDVV